MTAAEFLREIKKERLSGREFLALIGHTEISNEDYSEIKENPGLTYARLVEILENSPLTGEDYSALLKTARERRVKRVQKKTRRELENSLTLALSESENVAEPAPEPEQMDITEEITLVDDDEDIKELDNSEEDLWGDDAPVSDEYKEFNSGDEPEIDEYGSGEDFDENAPRENRVRRIICISLGVVLVFMSFFVRYITTGSWALPDDSFKAPEIYEDIFSLQAQLTSQTDKLFPFEKRYNAESFGVEPRGLRSLCNNSDYIFKTDGNEIKAVKTNLGVMTSVPFYNRDDMELLGIFLQRDRLYAVYNSEYSVDFDYFTEIDEIPVKQSFSFVQPSVTVLGFDTLNWNATPVTEYTQDGTFNDIIIRDTAFFIITDYEVMNNLSPTNYDGYIPAYKLNNQRSYVPMDNITIMKNSDYSSMTVIAGITPEKVTAYAISGGKADFVYEFGNTLVLTLSDKGRTTLIKYNVYENTLNNPVSVNVKGEVKQGFVDYRNGIMRVPAVVRDEISSVTLYILDDDMSQTAVIEKIASGEELRGAAYDDRAVYVIAEQLYAINTSMPENPVFLQEINTLISEVMYYSWGEGKFFSVSINADNEGNRQGVTVTMYVIKSDGSPEIIDEITHIPPNLRQGTVEMPSEHSREVIAVSYDSGIITVPIVYHTRVTEVEQFLIIGYSEYAGFDIRGFITDLDLYSSYNAAVISNGYVYCFFDDMIISSTTSGTVVSVFNM
ncbi:MAG: beta-propeller domain-containing protein [Oscillospiraceae bacterium]|nr:beta-propeller domain-containing protein [Oscillospiraceae bacterium]